MLNSPLKWIRPMLARMILSVLLFLSLPAYSAEPPPVDDVFQLSAHVADPNTMTFQWHIQPGFFLYRDKIKLTPSDNGHYNLGDIRFPEAETKTDKLGKTEYGYRKQLTLTLPVLGEKPGQSTLYITYQGCAEDGFCYPPQQKAFQLTIDAQLNLTAVTPEPDAAIFAVNATPNAPVNDEEALLRNNYLLITLLSFFGLGLLLSMTPCVLPMVPVLSGIIVGHGKNLTTRKAFLLSLSYVLSMAITYAFIGAIIALLGENLQVALQTPVVLATFSALFVLLALSMFGFYELKLPVSWQAKLASVSKSHANGHYFGAAFMGAVSTLILSPCVTAPLIGALSYIANTGHVLTGSLALFALGLGMGTPLLVIGASAGKWLPKAGHWMNAVKAFFGVLLLGVAIHLLDRVLPNVVVMILWSALLVLSGIYAGAFTPAASHARKCAKGAGILLFVYGLLILIGASMGETNPLQPLSRLQSTARATTPPTHQTVKTYAELQTALNNAKGKPVMLDFYADWCTSCKVMEKTTLSEAQVKHALSQYSVIKVDVSQNTPLMKQFQVIAPPTFIFYNADGQELSQKRLVGEVSAQTLLEHLRS